MTKHSINLLSDTDLEYVDRIGLPYPVPSGLVAANLEGHWVLSVKMLQMLQYACEKFGLPASRSAVSDESGYLRLCRHINDEILIRAEAALRADFVSNKIPLQEQEHVAAVLSGNQLESLAAATRLGKLKAYGSNVIPVSFK